MRLSNFIEGFVLSLLANVLMDNNGVSQKKRYKGENKELISELGLVIQRFSNFSRFWSVSAFSVLSLSLTLGVVYLKVSDKVCLKILILIIFLATVVLSNLMAINYLALEKSARNQYNKIKSGHQKNIE